MSNDGSASRSGVVSAHPLRCEVAVVERGAFVQSFCVRVGGVRPFDHNVAVLVDERAPHDQLGGACGLRLVGERAQRCSDPTVAGRGY